MKCKKDINYEVYLVSDRDVLKGRDFIKSLEETILGGVGVIQLREKGTNSLEFYNLAVKVKELTSKYNVPLIINDRVDIAVAVDAEGVHVGQNDIPANVVRSIIGEGKIVGVSTATLEEAKKAVENGADYIGVGALFPTGTKADTRRVSLEQLKDVKDKISIPVVGIGGINETNIDAIMKTGIDGVAVVSAILGKENIKEAVQNLHRR